MNCPYEVKKCSIISEIIEIGIAPMKANKCLSTNPAFHYSIVKP
jgi:hypothetical protein